MVGVTSLILGVRELRLRLEGKDIWKVYLFRNRRVERCVEMCCWLLAVYIEYSWLRRSGQCDMIYSTVL